MQILQEALTFDDVLLVPAHSTVLPRDVEIKTQLTRDISLNIPLVSAAMDTVTEARLAIAIAQEGGIGIIHKNMTTEQQAREVRRVKKYESGVINDPITVAPDVSIRDVIKLTRSKNISGVPVVNGDELVGIVTSRDLRFETRFDEPVSKIMTPKDRLVTVHENADRKEAIALLHEHRIEKVLVVNGSFHLRGMITVKDIQKAKDYPQACKDRQERLRVGAAVGTGHGTEERVAELVAAGVDVIIVDTAHGHSQGVLNRVRWVKQNYPGVQVIGGNIATAEAARALVDAGADGVKVGIGPGSICTTRIIAGVGVPQITAVSNVAEALKGTGVPLIADGGIHVDVQARGVGAGGLQPGHRHRCERLVHLEQVDVADRQAGFFSAASVAGSGASSMITGSWPSRLMWCTRASGFTPSAFRPRSLTTITPEAPSQIWLEVAAVSCRLPAAASRCGCRPGSRRSGCPRRHVHLGAAVGQADLDGHDLVVEQVRTRGSDRALVALEREAIEVVLRQPILLRHHLGAHELAELDAGVALLDPRALVLAEAVLRGQRRRQAHRHPRHALDARGDHHVHRARHHRLRGEVQRLLRRAALPVDAGAGTLSGSFEASTALRATLIACSPTWPTQPMITSSTSAGSAPLRSTSASSTLPARSAGCHPASRPPFLPPAVLAAATMYASAISLSSSNLQLCIERAPRRISSRNSNSAGTSRCRFTNQRAALAERRPTRTVTQSCGARRNTCSSLSSSPR